MIALLGSGRGWEKMALVHGRNDIGSMLGPRWWRNPEDGEPYAVDNDAFDHSFLGQHPDSGWWCREGEKAWLHMLDKMIPFHKPLFVLLPDEVGDWKATLVKAFEYRYELAVRGLPIGLALQNGANFEEALDFQPDYVFIAGTTEWKWLNAKPACEFFQPKSIKVHIGRTPGEKHIREAKRIGADSCDSMRWAKFPSEQPKLIRQLDGFETNQFSLIL